MFAAHRIKTRNTVCFSDLDRAARLSEIVEAGAPFYAWAKENNKEPKYFSEWSNVIAEYHREKGTPWIEPIAINSPYGYMGFDLIKPPKVESKPIQFGNNHTNDLVLSEDSDEEYDSDDSFLSLLGMDEFEDDKYSHLNEAAETFMLELDDAAIKIQCWIRCHRAKHRRAAIVSFQQLTVKQISAKEMPYCANFLDLPSGMSILLDDDDIEFSDTPIGEESENEDQEVDAEEFIRKYAPADIMPGLLEEKHSE
jgi:hypothetical protein